MSEKLYPHLIEIDRTAQERVDTMLPHMMEAAGVTEELKACDPMRWVGLMNTLKAQAEKIISVSYTHLFKGKGINTDTGNISTGEFEFRFQYT